MKNLLPFAFLITTALFSSCMKDVIGPKAEKAENTQNPVVTSPSSDNYLPLAKGNIWNYNINLLGADVPLTFVVTGNTKTINGKLYYETNATTQGTTTPGYFSHNGSLYTDLNIETDPQAVQEEPFLDDSQPVNGTYTLKGNDVGITGGFPFRYVVAIKEKGISFTVNSKVYQNVIHTHMETQYDTGSGFVTSESQEYYFAKGIGIIEVDQVQGGITLLKQTILSYTLK